jgi:hypothetical protein
MYTPGHITPADPVMLGTFGHNSMGGLYTGQRLSVPSSGTYSAANRIFYAPFHTTKPYSLARWWWQNGTVVGTNYFQIGIYDENFNLFRASPRTLSAGTVNQLQYANPGIHGTNLTSGASSTDGTVYTTASVTLKAGVLYCMSVENTATSAAVVSSIDSATGGYPTFTSRSTIQFNGTANRVSIWSAVPTADFTGTLRINFGATQTGACWSLNAFYHVDTATTDGIVQNATGTGNSVTPLATLAAYGSAENVGHAAFGINANATGAPTSTATKELSDGGATTPAQALQTTMAHNDTTMDETITAVAWGACAVEIKSLGTGAVYVPPMRGWLAIHGDGITATLFRTSSAQGVQSNIFIQSTALTGFPDIGTPTSSSTLSQIWNYGFTRRTSP